MIKILLLEDDAILSDLMSEHLASIGYSVDIVASGDQALEFAENYSYDIFIFDTNVPDISSAWMITSYNFISRY